MNKAIVYLLLGSMAISSQAGTVQDQKRSTPSAGPTSKITTQETNITDKLAQCIQGIPQDAGYGSLYTYENQKKIVIQILTEPVLKYEFFCLTGNAYIQKMQKMRSEIDAIAQSLETTLGQAPTYIEGFQLVQRDSSKNNQQKDTCAVPYSEYIELEFGTLGNTYSNQSLERTALPLRSFSEDDTLESDSIIRQISEANALIVLLYSSFDNQLRDSIQKYNRNNPNGTISLLVITPHELGMQDPR